MDDDDSNNQLFNAMVLNRSTRNKKKKKSSSQKRRASHDAQIAAFLKGEVEIDDEDLLGSSSVKAVTTPKKKKKTAAPSPPPPPPLGEKKTKRKSDQEAAFAGEPEEDDEERPEEEDDDAINYVATCKEVMALVASNERAFSTGLNELLQKVHDAKSALEDDALSAEYAEWLSLEKVIQTVQEQHAKRTLNPSAALTKFARNREGFAAGPHMLSVSVVTAVLDSMEVARNYVRVPWPERLFGIPALLENCIIVAEACDTWIAQYLEQNPGSNDPELTIDDMYHFMSRESSVRRLLQRNFRARKSVFRDVAPPRTGGNKRDFNEAIEIDPFVWDSFRHLPSYDAELHDEKLELIQTIIERLSQPIAPMNALHRAMMSEDAERAHALLEANLTNDLVSLMCAAFFIRTGAPPSDVLKHAMEFFCSSMVLPIAFRAGHPKWFLFPNDASEQMWSQLVMGLVVNVVNFLDSLLEEADGNHGAYSWNTNVKLPKSKGNQPDAIHCFAGPRQAINMIRPTRYAHFVLLPDLATQLQVRAVHEWKSMRHTIDQASREWQYYVKTLSHVWGVVSGAGSVPVEPEAPMDLVAPIDPVDDAGEGASHSDEDDDEDFDENDAEDGDEHTCKRLVFMIQFLYKKADNEIYAMSMCMRANTHPLQVAGFSIVSWAYKS